MRTGLTSPVPFCFMENKKFNMSRDMYKGIKKMNSEQLNSFLNNVFNEGVKAAISNTNSITLEDLHTAISSVKGIGNKRMDEIDEAIKKLFQEKGVS